MIKRSEKSRLAFLCNWDSPHSQRWPIALSDRGYDVHVITQHNDSTVMGDLHLHPLPFRTNLGYFLNIPFVRKILTSIKPHILHAHYATGYGTLGSYSSWHPYLISIYGADVYDFPQKSHLHRSLVGHNLRSADMICSTSKNMVKKAIDLFPDLQNFAVTPFGIDTKVFVPKPRFKDDNIITIGVIKLLLPDSGIDIVIKAVRKVIDHLQPIDSTLANKLRLLIVGSGYELSALVSLVKQLELAKITEFVPQVPHDLIPQYFQKMDIYCALSRVESFGVAALEASACEIPVVASRAEGLIENFSHSSSALFVDIDNVPDAANAILRLVSDPNLRSELGKNGRKNIIRNFEWKESVNIMESIYSRFV